MRRFFCWHVNCINIGQKEGGKSMERIWHKHVVEGNPVEIDIAEISLPELFMQSVTDIL